MASFFRALRPSTLNLLSAKYFKVIAIALTMALCSLTYSFHIEPEWIEVVPITLELPHLDPAFQGTRIAQLSDIHMNGHWMTTQRLHQIFQRVERLQPDIVVITGDLVDHAPQTNSPALIEPLTGLASHIPTFYVLGNHDYWDDPQPLRDALALTPAVELANTIYSFTRNGAQLHLAGVDDVWMGHDRLDLVMDQLPETGAAILLVHEPDFADTAAVTGRFDLSLSGHSHGGQVRIPFGGAPLLPPYGQRYPLGQYQVGTMVQYTNRGIGTAMLNIRFNCRPEITVFTLAAAT